MRIWSIHPKYLDTKGLVALWREALLAQHVLAGKTKGYRNHPQLARFKEAKNPLDSINQYLSEVFKEAVRRGYNFDRSKIDWNFDPSTMKVTKGQIAYEKAHLLTKLTVRDSSKFKEIDEIKTFETHPLFIQTEGQLEDWEVV